MLAYWSDTVGSSGRVEMASPGAGDILLVRGRDPFSLLIRLATGSSYTHAAMFVNSKDIIEAKEFDPVRQVDAKRYAGRSSVFRVVCGTVQRARACAAIRQELGLPYGWDEVLDYAAEHSLHIPMLVRLRHYDCSGLVCHSYKSNGVDLVPDELFPSPAQLADSPALVYVGEYRG